MGKTHMKHAVELHMVQLKRITRQNEQPKYEASMYIFFPMCKRLNMFNM